MEELFRGGIAMVRSAAILVVGLTWASLFEGEERERIAVSSQLRAGAVAVTQAYRDAWLANDSERVMATLTRDAVLLPSGLEPIAGEAAIRKFWWPGGGLATTVTAMEQTVDDVSGSCGVAIVRGHGSLTFRIRQDGKEELRTQRSTFLNFVRRQPDGSWRITHRMWSDLR